MLVVAIGMIGCGSNSSKKTGTAASAQPAGTPTTLALSISEVGKKAKYSGAASVKGGLVTMQLTNSGKTPHGAQLIRILGGHTIEQALKTIGGQSNKTPNWLHAEGGIGIAIPGSTASATLDLPAGSYAIADVGAAESGQGGPPAFTALTVTPAQSSAALMPSGTTITAAAPSKDHYKWEVSGPLKVGENEVTFESKGKEALHEVTAIRIIGNPSKAQILKDLSSNGPPPSYVDQTSQAQTAVLDGGKSLITHLTFSKPGKYILFCHLNDRDGGKPHFKEGLLTTVTVQ
jgi:plastocyanin